MQMEQTTVAASHFLLKNPVGILNQYLSVHATLHIDLSVDFPVSPPGLSTPGFAPLPYYICKWHYELFSRIKHTANK